MKQFKIGVQLYSVRDDMEKDFEGTLKKVAEMGYEYVEFAGYYGRSSEEIKALIEEFFGDFGGRERILGENIIKSAMRKKSHLRIFRY